MENQLIQMTRESLIEWLCWNDKNGIYTDADCELEGYDPLTREEALEIALAQVRG